MYRQIVQALADDIALGRVAGGERLPPHRDLADALSVARGTVARAYAEAEKLGLVAGDVGRGTFVISPDTAAPRYATLLEPPTVFNDLTTNHPLTGIDPDPADALRELASRPDRRALLRYQSNLGTRRHRLVGVQWARRFGVVAAPENVLVCSGAQHALFVTLAHLVEPGDGVLVEEWSYPGLFGIAKTLKIRLIPVAMDDDGLCPDHLESQAARHRARVLYLMPTVHNPMGTVLSEARRRRIARIARKHDLSIIEDSAHQLLTPDPPPALRDFAPERSYFVASTSKVLCAGLRVAFLVCPPGRLAAVAEHLWATQWMVGPLGPEIVAIWLEQGVADLTLSRKRREAAYRQRLARQVLGAHPIRGNPHALHLWLELPRPWQADRFVARALKERLGVTPASAFWMRTCPPKDAIRIALGGVDERKTLRRELGRLATLLSSAPGSDQERLRKGIDPAV